ncbi:sensor histidine kinase [Paenibacillus glufosinatiresistens]|uniref:sensor histidine kinase n=1 Tax=Paenibacillus glufosinatiresistens TaxID=3070657 RepID=UPI00286E6F09|nr:HAMP domain-containing sensor histidine kinase [Paenibacillus sp. YX.27]
MFKKLRNRFLIVNLVTISLTMLLAFAAIYFITYQDVSGDISLDRQNIVEFYEKFPADRINGGQEPPADTQVPPADSPVSGTGTADAVSPGTGDGGLLHQGGRGVHGIGGPPPERSVSFMLLTDSDWKVTAKESRVPVDDTLYEDALQKAVAQNRNTGEFTLDGSRWTFEIQPTPQGHMLVFLDITARRDILTEMIYTFSIVAVVMLVILFFVSRTFANRSIKPVREAFDKQKQFIADASHELKTPLAVINTNTEVLLANPDETVGSQAKWLQYIKSETERMSRLTSDLLYLTRMDDARIGEVHAPFDLSEAVMDIMLTMEAVIYEQNVLLDYDIAPGLTVEGSREGIKQVVMILLDNAVKYSGPSGKVALTLKRQQGETLLTVSNTGEGIAPEHLERIFDRFYRTDTSRSRAQGGHGLGLAIAKSIVEQHKGRIYARSIPGERTTFYVQLS